MTYRMLPALALAVAILFAPSFVAAKTIIITSDGGGIVTNYVRWFRGIARRGDRVVVDGYCGSSCTLALAIPTTCATSRAVFGFHAAYRDVLGIRVSTDVELTRYFMSQYPPGIRAWLNARGGLTKDMKYLRGAQMRALVPQCR